ncbi:MAG TPA: di-heme oxidoredictase family protein [Thermoanaerobaculia bacterium]|nr:di-heme oxidoredictase family protein [Thermoanaerobaculia bacterium]
MTTTSRTGRAALLSAAILLFAGGPGHAQETDLTQTPNAAGVGARKSYAEQVGAGRGDLATPESSTYLIARDPFRSIRRGRNLFQRKFTLEQGLGPRRFDGIGDIETEGALGAGLADSCAACHGRPRGSAGVGGDVFTRPDSRDAPHLFGLGLVEMLADEITLDLREIRRQAIERAAADGRPARVALVSKGIRYGHLTVSPDGSVETGEIEGVDADLRVRPFFHHGGTISIREFVVGALRAEMGLEAVDPDLLAASRGERVVTPAGMVLDGALDRIEAPAVEHAWDDGDGDGVAEEVPEGIVDHLEFYLLNYFKPGTYRATPRTRLGRLAFERIGCTTCHVPDLMIEHDRRVADVETDHQPAWGGLNGLFATASARFDAVDDGSGHPALKQPRRGRFVVRGIYADFKRHDLGPAFHERNFTTDATNYDVSMQREFMTEPLWGVGSTAPYGHDGRSINLREVILRHGGEALRSRQGFESLASPLQDALVEFLQSLVLFPPDDTASNLNPGDPTATGYPQLGHGSIFLTALFNDPSDPE